ncbi:hypothetical protein A3B05_02605 [Candidatus Giovannonibacteria bacterium RIFCSPLOWO2_01_FULL_43_160]|uniref:PpiC-type peptidyl-prolyl cis-trans isomerase n=2 Tax=Candidatus Giovannoniibacteriota TaxID=1752738 RepID=A0A0G1LT42_9BACT|nr:MAG: hypothetical protein UV72_C0006G0008 [Candidatus Giovannonibacteria bacterium GW2011_GWB1_43_13]KKS99392.1 MAG: hypothetical protein UV75_C0005G0009 [Candidatus Giovannonibacteria bacterium GW2011_GWA1_43_15]KKT21770.1 MAG: hypothetical protein UW05_C0003G0006 [Candidatus Giovannonibacteria bacterium GW2011_GWC2_43_8]KKT62929.1 MAG: hypothetical protein UW55_C0008G0010 [Candidatus Giovannonibacteria bacterium GW2011_GWA2_44_26]OGF58736.1 MAG: hypothetical protein A2652_00625 [Candidatus
MLKIFTKKNIMISLIILFLGAVLYISFGFLPVLKVEGTLVGYAEFQKVNGAIGAFDKISRKSVSPPEEIKKMALESIIESRLLDELILEANPELAKKAEEILQRTLRGNKNLSLDEASKNLYGISAADFQKLVLLPQAKKDALTDYYESNPERLADLWSALLKTAKVKIYYPGFYWENGEIKIK